MEKCSCRNMVRISQARGRPDRTARLQSCVFQLCEVIQVMGMFLQEHNADYGYAGRFVRSNQPAARRASTRVGRELDEVFLQEHCGKLAL